MVKYFVETENEDFTLEIPDDATVNFSTAGSSKMFLDKSNDTVGVLTVRRTTWVGEPGNEWSQSSSTLLARYEDVIDVRSEEIKKTTLELA